MITVLAAALGFIAGTLFGIQLADWRRARLAERTPPMPNRPLPRRRAYVIFGILLAGLLLTGVAASVSWFRAAEASRQAQDVTEQLIEYQACQAPYQQRFGQIYSARIKPTREVFDALDRVMFAVVGQNRDDFSTSLQHYIDVRQRQARTLEENPPPPLPKKVCGVPPKVEAP